MSLCMSEIVDFMTVRTYCEILYSVQSKARWLTGQSRCPGTWKLVLGMEFWMASCGWCVLWQFVVPTQSILPARCLCTPRRVPTCQRHLQAGPMATGLDTLLTLPPTNTEAHSLSKRTGVFQNEPVLPAQTCCRFLAAAH